MIQKLRNVNVVLSEDALQDIDKVTKHLKAKGLQIKDVMPLTGMISGVCTAAKKPELAKVAGVLSVEYDLEVGLSPPDAEGQ